MPRALIGGMNVKHFTDLLVWQRAMDLVVEIYRITGAFPRTELYVLTSQTHRSAISIPSNIAEGFCRRSNPAYVNHLNIALGSEGELFTQLKVGERLGYVSAADLVKPLDDLSEIGRMINGLVHSLETKQQPHRSTRHHY
jgi:four helix bundle protein